MILSVFMFLSAIAGAAFGFLEGQNFAYKTIMKRNAAHAQKENPDPKDAA